MAKRWRGDRSPRKYDYVANPGLRRELLDLWNVCQATAETLHKLDLARSGKLPGYQESLGKRVEKIDRTWAGLPNAVRIPCGDWNIAYLQYDGNRVTLQGTEEVHKGGAIENLVLWTLGELGITP